MKNFKKVILTLLIAILGIGAANAQLRFGIKAGLNLNSFHFSTNKDVLANNVLNSDNRCGWTAGVMGEFQVPVIGLGFDLSAMYTRMASGIDTKEGTAEGYAKNFLEIPLNVKYKFSLPVVGRFLSPYLYTGPSFAFRLDKNTLKNMKSKTCQSAWNIGLGFEFLNHVQLQGSYGFAMNKVPFGILTKVSDEITGGTNETIVKAKNNYWTITVGYLF